MIKASVFLLINSIKNGGITVRSAVPAIAQYIFDRQQTPYIEQCGGNLQFKKMKKKLE
jgi:Fe-S cluster biogenesis protein NfuA